jgi:hypothetical protein
LAAKNAWNQGYFCGLLNKNEVMTDKRIGLLERFCGWTKLVNIAKTMLSSLNKIQTCDFIGQYNYMIELIGETKI